MPSTGRNPWLHVVHSTVSSWAEETLGGTSSCSMRHSENPRTDRCPFHDNVLRNGAASGVQVQSLFLAGRALMLCRRLVIGTLFFHGWSLAGTHTGTSAAFTLRACSGGLSTYLFPQTSSSLTSQPHLFPVLDHHPRPSPTAGRTAVAHHRSFQAE